MRFCSALRQQGRPWRYGRKVVPWMGVPVPLGAPEAPPVRWRKGAGQRSVFGSGCTAGHRLSARRFTAPEAGSEPHTASAHPTLGDLEPCSSSDARLVRVGVLIGHSRPTDDDDPPTSLGVAFFRHTARPPAAASSRSPTVPRRPSLPLHTEPKTRQDSPQRRDDDRVVGGRTKLW